MGAKTRIKSTDPYTDWYAPTAWFVEAGEMQTVGGRPVEVLGEVEEVPIVQTDGSFKAEALEELSQEWHAATGKKPMIINGPLKLMRMRRLRVSEVKRYRKGVGL